MERISLVGMRVGTWIDVDPSELFVFFSHWVRRRRVLRGRIRADELKIL